MNYYDLKQLIDISIDYENYTAQFYRDILGQVRGERPVSLVRNLLSQEMKHVEQLSDFKAKIDIAGFIQYPSTIRFELPGAKKSYSEMSYDDLLKIALDLEKKSYEFYKNAEAASPRGPVKDLFDALGNFEFSHIQLLNREITYSA
jgi:rubrerythrin